ncbi:MAG TPA: hypothetical protein ENN19_05075 [Chloroflexi bacterium]|nr:hypothetical protein [Chloroflexota bacterium]
MRRKYVYRGIVSLALFVVMLWAGEARAGRYWLAPAPAAPGDPFPLVQGAGDLFRPVVAMDGSVVVWYAWSDDGLDVFGLALEAGQPQGAPFTIGGGPGEQAAPAISPGREGDGYLVVWHSRRDEAADFDVYARYLDARGRPVDDPFPVAAGLGDQLRPAVAYAPVVDRFVVVWQGRRAGAEFDLHARLIPSLPRLREQDGEISGGTFTVSSAPGDQLTPAVACEIEAPRCLVAWMDTRNANTLDTDIFGRMIDANAGTVLGDEIDVAVERWYQDSPAVIYNPVSRAYMLVWNDDIESQLVSSDGRSIGGRINVSRESPFQYKPAIAVNAAGNYLIVWEDGRRQAIRGMDIYGQRLSPDGAPLGRNFALSTEAHNQYAPTVAFDPRLGAFFAVWEDDRESDDDGNSYLVLYGQILSDDADDEKTH